MSMAAKLMPVRERVKAMPRPLLVKFHFAKASEQSVMSVLDESPRTRSFQAHPVQDIVPHDC